jgi:uncharacterized protein YbaA (DUF1428 family)
MPGYVDGYLMPIPKKSLDAYLRIARAAGRIWREHGALQYVECVGEDLAPRGVVPFTRSLRTRRGETVIFAFVVYRSRAHRDRVNRKVMNDPRIAAMGSQSMPFEPKRMVYGGFEVRVDA